MNVLQRQLIILRNLYRGRFHSTAGGLKVVDLLANEMEIVENLKKTGIHVCHDFMSAEIADSIKSRIDQKLDEYDKEKWLAIRAEIDEEKLKWGVADHDGSRLWIDAVGCDQRILHAELLAQAIYDFAFNKTFTDSGSAFLKSKIELKFCMANRSRYRDSNLGSGGGWHRDSNYKKSFKALVYLVDTNESNGCFQYLPKSSSISHHLMKTNTPDKYTFTDEEVKKMISRESDILSVCGAKGTLVLFDTNGIHRGKPLEYGGERYALTNYYD
jgi:ectoine hydroxylase-related dioxygenase (phytanoyl-CoA dioxygenase family)